MLTAGVKQFRLNTYRESANIVHTSHNFYRERPGNRADAPDKCRFCENDRAELCVHGGPAEFAGRIPLWRG